MIIHQKYPINEAFHYCELALTTHKTPPKQGFSPSWAFPNIQKSKVSSHPTSIGVPCICTFLASTMMLTMGTSKTDLGQTFHRYHHFNIHQSLHS